MTNEEHAVESTSPEDTRRLAIVLSNVLLPGDVVLLEGPVGAGKSHFARSAILNLLSVPEDVPSPTYTLVQTYETPVGEVWHADLYRISDPTEMHELGLMAAFEDAICFVEWPDRLGTERPEKALTVTLDPQGGGDARIVTFAWAQHGWDKRLKEALRDRSDVT